MSQIPGTPSSLVPCPRCGEVLPVVRDKSDVTCVCGFSAFLPYVQEAHYLRSGLPAWQARLAELDDAIARGLRPETTLPAHPGFPTQDRHKTSTSGYQFLVAGGSILLFAGLAAFVGIMWRYLGTAGQGAVLSLITITLAAISIRLVSRIPSTAAALAGLTVGSWLIDAGWAINRVGITNDLVKNLTIPSVLAVVTALVFTFAGSRFENSIWTLVGQVFIPSALGLSLTSIALHLSQIQTITSVQLSALALPLTCGAVLILGNGPVIQRSFPGISRFLALAVLYLYAIGFVIASFISDDRAALVWAVHLAALTIFAWRVRGSEYVAPYTAVLVFPLAIEYFRTSNSLTAVALGLAVFPLSLLLLALVEFPSRLHVLVPQRSRLLLIILTSVIAFHYLTLSFTIDHLAYYSWSVHFLVLAGIAFRRDKLRFCTAFFIVSAVILSAGFVDLPVGARVVIPALACLGSLRFTSAGKVPVPLLVSISSGVWILVAFIVSPAHDVQCAAAVLGALTGAVILIQTWRTKVVEFAILAAAFLASTVVLTNAYYNVTTLESFTLPIATVLLVSGAVANRIDPTLSSLVWLAPSCASGILPSAVRASELLSYSQRFTTTLIATLVVLIFGARLRYVGMLVVGIVSVVILARNPFAFLFSTIQPWITFTLSGILLLVIGARFEDVHKRAGAAKEWITGTLR